MITIIKPDFVFEDERGSLIQLVHEGYKQINVCTSKAGVERGRHFHRFSREGFYVIEGSFTVEAKLGDKKEFFDFKKGDMFVIERNVIHTFDYHEDSVLVAFYDNGVELSDGTKDIIAEEDA
ncbi:MAG: cupin domain-containing protein [Clostridia bacterium]|nr:cupin domain-containing protein [Clostridia bacterium]